MSPPLQATMDISMAVEDGVTGNPKGDSRAQHMSTAISANDPPPSQTKVLNLRQRKWNSVSKEWQEWQDVQATHAPDLPSPPSQQPQSLATPSTMPPTAAGFAILRPTNVYNSGTGAESLTNMQGRTPSSSSQQIDSEQLSDFHHTNINNNNHGKEGGLGRQRSLHKAREKYNAGHAQDESRSSFGSRARSFSETNIYPYTQYQDYQQHQQQQQQQQQQQNQQQHFGHQQLNQMSTPSSYFPVHQWDSDVSDAAAQHYQHHRHDTRLRQPVQETVHLGHPSRHHSDHLYPHHGDTWVGPGAIENTSARLGTQSQGHSPRLRHSVSGSSASARPQSPWMDLTMTALDGSVNTPTDRFPRQSSHTSSIAGSATGALSASSSHGQRLEEMSSWNQHLHKAQNGYRETLGISRHGGYGRSSPVQYAQYHHQHQHHSQEDVSMGEETVRLMPSRSSSPSPCLSMAPTITRPLSISFSHLTGANMLADLTEHEYDEDMEL
ncbi:hypothetical protein BGX24_010626 [Mortierella sp. AD032]|nr:hypothetical protein BGX24_010626 [Mortierella sp. AD032]